MTDDVIKMLEEKIVERNNEGQLYMQLIMNVPMTFQGTMVRYGKFRGVNSYVVVAGHMANDLDERVGYYGEHLVLVANTCNREHEGRI